MCSRLPSSKLLSLTDLFSDKCNLHLNADAENFYIQLPKNGRIPCQHYSRDLNLPWPAFKTLFFQQTILNSIEYETVHPNIILTKGLLISSLNCWSEIYHNCGPKALHYIFHKCIVLYKSGDLFIAAKGSRTSKSRRSILKLLRIVSQVKDHRDFLLGNLGKIFIDKKKYLFYKTNKIWPRNSLLYKSNLNPISFVNNLITLNFAPDCNFDKKCFLTDFLKAIETLIRRHKKVLPFKCIYLKYFSNSETGPVNMKIFGKFLKSLILQFIPSGLVGGKDNLILYADFVKVLLFQSGNQTFTVNDMIEKVFMSPKSTACLTGKVGTGSKDRVPLWLYGRMLLWITECYIFNILRLFFYFSLSYNLEVCIYTRQYWENRTNRVYKSLIHHNVLTHVPEEKSPTHSIRFITKPDENEFRPLIPARCKEKSQLIECSYSLLQQLIKKKKDYLPEHEGLAKNGLEAIWPAYVDRAKHAGIKHLYYVKVDIKDAFGSVDHDVLINIIQNDMNEISGNAGLDVLQFHFKSDLFVKPYLQFTSLPCTLKKGVAYEDPTKSKVISKDQIQDFLIESLTNVTVKLKYREGVYKLVKGLPQGSQLSSFFCDLYYATLDQEYLQDFIYNVEDLFLRSVDDYLYLTPFRDYAERFKKIMEEGFPKYKVKIKVEKTLSNLDHPDTHHVPYFGFLLDLSGLQIEPYLKTYINRKKILNSVTFKFLNMSVIKRRMTNIIGVKMNKLLFNEHNSKKTMYTNLWVSASILALRFSAMTNVLNDLDEKELVYYATLGCSNIARLAVQNSTRLSMNCCKCIALNCFVLSLTTKSNHLYHLIDVLSLVASRYFHTLGNKEKKKCLQLKNRSLRELAALL